MPEELTPRTPPHDPKLANEGLKLIMIDLELESDENIELLGDPIGRLHEIVRQRLQVLLDHDFSKLLNAMYRMDISEDKFKQILHLSEPGEIAQKLSVLIVKREMAKVFTRRKYRFS